MKKIERSIWIVAVTLLLIISLFGIFINDASAGNIISKMPSFKKFIKVLNIIQRDYVDEEEIDQEI